MKSIVLAFLFFIIPCNLIYAETLEEQLNHLIGPKQQYNTILSPVYLRSQETEEQISPQSGELTLTQTDYVLPGRNGLDLEIKRIYKSGISNVQEMKVKYVNGAWVDYVHSDAKTSSFYEDRYNLGIGMRFSFPNIEVNSNEDGTSHKFLHTESGDVYRLRAYKSDGELVYLPEGQTVKDVVVKESATFKNGQNDGTSKYVMTEKNGKKSFFAEDGRLLGIEDRFGNRLVFEYVSLSYTLDGTTINKKLISKITDAIGRVTTFEYKEDSAYKVGPIVNQAYDKEDSYKASQNPNDVDSGDLQGKFQVIVHLPNGKQLVYDKTAVLVNASKQVMRTRLQRVYDVDNKPKYHFWYEQPSLGFTYTNGTTYSAFNRYENLVQIDNLKKNQIKRYIYNSYTKVLNEGSMQYRKIFEHQDWVKSGYDASKSKFEDKFMLDPKEKIHYTYTNDASGFGTEGYKPYDDVYLRDKYRYYTEQSDIRGSTTKYTYDGLHQLLETEFKGPDHKEIVITDRDELKLIKKQERQLFHVVKGEAKGKPTKKIENYRYDEYGNLTNYTGSDAKRDDKGYPIDNEHTIVYAYAYDKFHAVTSKTWKQDKDTINQELYTINEKGNVTQEVKSDPAHAEKSIMTNYQYDLYGNITKKAVQSNGQSFDTYYEYGIDAVGTDTKGAYLTKEYGILDGKQAAKKYAYDLSTGNRIQEVDARGQVTAYQYDTHNRVAKSIRPGNVVKGYVYEEHPYNNFNIQVTDAEGTAFRYVYDTAGALVESNVQVDSKWKVLKQYEYDNRGNKVKEKDSNGHSIRYEYDSNYRLIKKSLYELDTTNKGSSIITYQIGMDEQIPMLVTITDEEGYSKKYYYDLSDRLTKVEVSPDRTRYFATTYTYDYAGNKRTETDARNLTSHYAYDNFGRMISSQDAAGNNTTFTYNALHQITLQEEPNHKTTDMAYDALGRLVKKRVYTTGAKDYTYVIHQYDLASNVLRTQEGKVAGNSDVLSSDKSYTYDAYNQLTDEFAVIDDSRRSHVKHSYDKNGKMTGTVAYTDSSESKYREHTYIYDYAGRVKEEKWNEHDGTAPHVSRHLIYELDHEGNIVKEQAANGSGFDTIVRRYDYKNRLLEKIESNRGKLDGKRTSYQYDKKGNLIAETLVIQGKPSVNSYNYDGLGKLVRKTDATGNATTYVYDPNGNRIKEVDPRYATLPVEKAPGMEYEYDSLNRMVKTYVFDGNKKELILYKVYDGRGNVLVEAKGEGANTAQPDKSYGETFEYDANDQQVVYTSAQTQYENRKNGTDNKTATFSYNGSGQRLTETDALGRTTQYAYYLNEMLKEKTYADKSRETFDYDLSGKAMMAVTDREGRVTRTFSNLYDKPYRIEYPDGSTEKYVYSLKGELLQRQDRAGNTHFFEYDAASNMVRKLEFIQTDGPLQEYRLTEFDYDEANRVLSSETFLYQTTAGTSSGGKKIASGDKVEHIYNLSGLLIQTKGPFGKDTRYEYDPAGNRVTKLQKVDNGYDDVTRFVFDVRSHVVKESRLVKPTDLSSNVLDNINYDDEYYDRMMLTTHFSYDKSGQIVSKTSPQGHMSLIQYDYDGRPVKQVDPLKAATIYRYDSKGNLSEEVNPNGFVTAYEYDPLDRVIRKHIPVSGGAHATWRYVYDKVGNLIKEIAPNQYDHLLDNGQSVLGMAGTRYTYDVMNRRTRTESPYGVLECIAYDKQGLVQKIVDGLSYTGDLSSSKGTLYAYDGLGRVKKKTDVSGHSTLYAYDIWDHAVKVTDARGYSTHYTYNADGTLNTVAYPDGGSIKYEYDKLGRKTSEVNQLGNTTIFSYNVFDKEKSVTDPYGQTIESRYDLDGNMISSKDKRGSITLYEYDASNRLIGKKLPLEQDESGNIVYAVETYTYDAVGNLLKQRLTGSKDSQFLRETTYTYTPNDLTATAANNSGAFTKNSYDKNGNLVQVDKLRESSLYDVERYEYDDANRLVKQIRFYDESDMYLTEIHNLKELRDSAHPGQIRAIAEYEYDVLGRRVKEYDPRAAGLTDASAKEQYGVTYAYDDMGRVEKISRQHNGKLVFKQYGYDENGNKVTEQNENGYVTTFTYDTLNRMATATNPANQTIAYQYDLVGNRTIETDALQESMTYTYDKLNRLITVLDANHIVIIHHVYDANGNVVKKIEANGYLAGDTDEKRQGWHYKYDLANRLVSTQDPELASQEKSERYSFVYRYNPSGEKIKEVNGLGLATIYDYDNAGRLLKVTDALGVNVSYSYNLLGSKLEMIDGKGKVTRYRYGVGGKLREVIDPNGNSIKYQYDLAANIAEVTDRNGNHTVYTYDSRNMLLGRTVKESKDSIQYTYDATGSRITMQDETGTTTYSYDGNKRLLTLVKDGKQQLAYTYDANGNTASVKDKTGYVTAFRYDKSNRMIEVEFDGKKTAYRYDAGGNQIAVLYEGGVHTEYTYDRANRLLSLVNKKSGASTISKFHYTYDAAGRQTSKTDSYGTTHYAYDGVGRVTKVEAPGKVTLYTYDRNGNRISLSETYVSEQPSGFVDVSSKAQVKYSIKKSHYMYSSANELLQLVEKMSDQAGTEVLERTITYLYDANGNELRQKSSFLRPHQRDMRQSTGGNPYGEGIDGSINSVIEKVSNTYDGFNRLNQVERIKDGERVLVDYQYDGDNLRTTKVVRSSKEQYAPQSTHYLYDRQHVVLESDASGQATVRYVFGKSYIARIGSSTTMSYYLYNGHGDVVQTVKESGEVENQYDYDIFGSAVLSVELYHNDIRHAGEFYDEETGLYYLRARYYNPQVGRFVTADSYWGEDTNPLSLNLYTYVYNNPLIYWDPTGYWVQRDQKLNANAQAQIIALTSAYYSASTKSERKAIEAKANAIRNSNEARQTKPSPLQVESSKEIKSVVTKAIQATTTGDKKISPEEWKQMTSSSGITYHSEMTTNYSAGPSRNTTTVTYIGRADLKVSVTSNLSSGRVEPIKQSISYKVTPSEGKFVMDLIANSDLSAEKSVTILTMMEKNKGKISESEAKKVFGSNTNYDTDIIELMYRTNILYGMNIAQVENAMQDQRMYNTYGLAAAMTAARVVPGMSVVRNEATSSGARTWEQATKSKPSATKPPADKAAASAAGGNKVAGKFLDAPATSNGTLNIGARGKPTEGAYNIDINPKASGVHYGDATNLSNIKTGSQSKIIIENPYGYDPLNPEVMRVLSKNGEIKITGSRSNMNKLVKTLDDRGLKLKGEGREIPNDGSFKTTDGENIKSVMLDQYTIIRK
ncbi:RHS repeat-associated core domain-containing protein [Paenibacillus sp. ACRRX]|uniref:RHS repeat-associated core domain-containing protein n=1 Tax=Paenibacillus sp. ACRRX TaxID=2918206 RepID=UPI001EF61F85|nr:RHS repeat-associated core domain-containing protein [Paenibacillus sp. ACRRX]